MAKYYGSIGYGITSQTRPGVWTEGITERVVYGDIIKNTKLPENSGNLNDDIKLSMKISFLMDPFASQHFHLIKYATYNDVKWKVTSIDNEYPRIVLTLGGVYNVPQQ